MLDFQEHLVTTMMALEDTYFSMAEKCQQNVLIIADRGVLDASAFIERDDWERILKKLDLEDIEINDNRYNHVVHLQVIQGNLERFIVFSSLYLFLADRCYWSREILLN